MNELEDKVIGDIYVGEGVEDSARHLAKWMTEHLKKGTTIEQSNKMWKEYWASSDYECNLDSIDRVPGMSFNKIDNEEEYWEDTLDFEGDFPEELYEKAVKEKADKFITFNNNAYIDIVAIRGFPSGKEIGISVLGKENAGEWSKEDDESFFDEEYLKDLKQNKN